MDLKEYTEAFNHLHTAKVKGHKAPHKAVLLLSIIDLVECNIIRFPQIELTDELINQFNLIWRKYLGESSIFSPDITKPYFHMQYEPFWKLIEKYDTEAMVAAEEEVWRKKKADKKNLPTGGYSVKSLRNAFEYAEIDEQLFELMRNADSRDILRAILINEYLCDQPTKKKSNFKLIVTLSLMAIVA